MGNAATGFGYSIYFMLLAVFSIAGFVVWKIAQAARRFAALESVGGPVEP